MRVRAVSAKSGEGMEDYLRLLKAPQVSRSRVWHTRAVSRRILFGNRPGNFLAEKAAYT